MGSTSICSHILHHCNFKICTEKIEVENFLEGSLDLIPSLSLSVKNSNHGQESVLEVQRQNIAGHCQKTFCIQKFVDYTQQCFAAHNLNFH